MTKKIELPAQTDPATIMRLVEQTAAQMGFTVEHHTPTSATLHDGPRLVTGQSTATRARVGLTIEPERLLLRSETTGAALTGAAGVSYFQTRINWRYSKLARHIKKAIRNHLPI